MPGFWFNFYVYLILCYEEQRFIRRYPAEAFAIIISVCLCCLYKSSGTEDRTRRNRIVLSSFPEPRCLADNARSPGSLLYPQHRIQSFSSPVTRRFYRHKRKNTVLSLESNGDSGFLYRRQGR